MKKTKAKKYESRYSPDKEVSAAQYITELICEKKAIKEGRGELPSRFWTLPEWEKHFKQQIVTAHSLLRIYDGEAVIKALRSDDARNIFSLRAPHLDPIIKREQARFEAEKAREKEAIAKFTGMKRADTNAKPVQRKVKKNALAKLRELDGEESSGDSGDL